jgi:signal transduction histidine kinase
MAREAALARLARGWYAGLVPNVDAGAGLARLAAASARIRAATGADDVLDLVAEAARAFAGARDAWAARVELATVIAVRAASDGGDRSSASSLSTSPPLAALLEVARPLARTDEFLALAMPGSSGTTEGILALPRTADDGGAVLELVLGQLATVAGLALECARLRARVESVTRVREVLLASVSHDLRNPLNTFAMSAGLLRDDLERNDMDRARGLSLVSRMERATARMQALIEDLAEASRLDARKIDLVTREEKAAQLVKDAAQAARAAAPEKSAAVTCEPFDDDPIVLADRSRTLQALAKVIAFESKATGDAGEIHLGVSKLVEEVVFTARAFAPGGEPMTPPEEGRGALALLIARSLVEAQRGTFRIEPGDALVVVFTLPAKA